MKIMDAIKEHPYFAAGGVFVLGVVLIVILASGSSKQAATTVIAQPTTDTGAATQLAMAQLSAAASTTASNNALSSQTDYDSSTVQIAKISADASNNHDLNVYNTTVGLATVQAGQAIAVSTIGANLGSHEADLNAATNQAAIAAQAATAINGQNVAGNVAINQTNVAGNVAINQTDVEGTVASQGIAAQLLALQGQQNVDLQTAQLSASTIINGQNIAATINGQNTAATINGQNTAASMNATNQDYAYWMNASNNDTSVINNAVNNGNLQFAAMYDVRHLGA